MASEKLNNHPSPGVRGLGEGQAVDPIPRPLAIRVLKLVSGMMMLGLGLILLMKPEALNSLTATAAVIGASVALSAGIAWVAGRVHRVRSG